MRSLPYPDLLTRAIWHALTTAHQPLAQTCGQARRYPADVAPFAALAEPTPAASRGLASLLEPEEFVYLLESPPAPIAGLVTTGVLPCLQMIFPGNAPLPTPAPGTLTPSPLTCAQAPAMMALIALAYPGFFRSQTCRMGRYWGLHAPDGTLVAMGGERLMVSLPGQPRLCEISGLCTHPDHAGKGLGSVLLAHIVAQHRAEGAVSWLHVTQTNSRAIALYRRLGFETLQSVNIHRLECAV